MKFIGDCFIKMLNVVRDKIVFADGVQFSSAKICISVPCIQKITICIFINKSERLKSYLISFIVIIKHDLL